LDEEQRIIEEEENEEGECEMYNENDLNDHNGTSENHAGNGDTVVIGESGVNN